VALRSLWPLRYASCFLSCELIINVPLSWQILLEQRYGRAVDWWAFGVLTYEMLLGQSPFRGDDEDEIFDAILEDEPLYPITMPRDAVSILQKVRFDYLRVVVMLY
jgi:serine/threonine protein kinase